MAFPIMILLFAALVIYLTFRRAKARRRTLLNTMQQTMVKVAADTSALQQGNVTVRVSSPEDAQGIRFGSAAEEIAKALASISPEQIQAQTEAALDAMRGKGSAQLSDRQKEAIQEAFSNGFSSGATVTFDTAPLTTQQAADVFAAAQAEPDLVPRKPVRPAPAPEAEPTTADPFSPGDVFDRNKKAADASFAASGEANTPKNRDPFS